jgi:hypothetical protein
VVKGIWQVTWYEVKDVSGMMTYYVYGITYDNVDRYCVWYDDDDADKLLTAGTKILSFSSVEKLQEHCNAEGLEVIDEGGKLIVPDKFATDSSEALNSFMDM